MPSTYGAKYTARKNVRPRKRRASSSATARGTTTSTGTVIRVNRPVACMPFQNSTETTS